MNKSTRRSEALVGTEEFGIRRALARLGPLPEPALLKDLQTSELEEISDRIRDFLLDVVPRVGGHLGAALGVVELTSALFGVFEFETRDTLVWDVGHQCYPHKILTGRAGRFATLRRSAGMSGFPDPKESQYDTVKTGHGGTSISTALGFALRNALHGAKARRAVAVIGDGSLQEGNAFEALNHAGTYSDLGLIVVLNDNGMAISPSVGAVHQSFRRPRSPATVHPAAGLAALMGFEYIGPVDGHDIAALRAALRRARFRRAPVLVHVLTEKGRGAPAAERDRNRVHAVSGYNSEACDAVEYPLQDGPTFTAVLGETACKLAADDERVVAITAAMADGTGLSDFALRYPERFHDVGMAEQHGVALAASFALSGLRPLCCIYSTFLQRAFDQLFQEVALQGAPVVFCVDRAGLVGSDGATHNGVFDIAYARCLPGFTILAPRDTGELQRMIGESVRCATGPVVIRYPRGPSRRVEAQVRSNTQSGINRAEVLADGEDGCILACGPMAYTALEARRRIQKRTGRCLSVVDARSIKPLDRETIGAQLSSQPIVFTLEDHVRAGGFGSAVLEHRAAESNGCYAPIVTLALPDIFVDHAPRAAQLGSAGLDLDSVVSQISRRLAVGPAALR